MRKILAGTVIGFGVLLATATSASASDLHYSGHHYPSYDSCEAGYRDLVGNTPIDQPHECRWNPVGVYELWWSR
ncbi:hypothetical protein [Amycolatopsis sp. CA-230715]|uniref:hypothetical protein n=1 Tax=Amycolatopsis sp. CA-230715 TaxID=2745196 RepID=UPI001C032AFF|nr:hypothetical protein [Amycolatopsis sp. CA-230715]QWF80970.1 hypothetical protein HUW46_04395 [Amycolatopsis sp. CA-230715]